MTRIVPLLVLLIAPVGCVRQFTERLDRGNQHLEFIRGELATGNARLTESAEQLRRMEQHMEDIKLKMATMERFMKRFGAGGVDAGTEVLAEPAPAPAALR